LKFSKLFCLRNDCRQKHRCSDAVLETRDSAAVAISTRWTGHGYEKKHYLDPFVHHTFTWRR